MDIEKTLDTPENELLAYQLEEMRKKSNKQDVVIAFLMIIVALGFCFFKADRNFIALIIAIVSLGVMVPFIKQTSELKREFKKLYKNTFLVGMLEEYFTDVDCQWKTGFDRDFVEELGIIEKGNRFHCEDYIKATYKGVHFEQSDVQIVRESSSGKNKKEITYFSGRMFEFNFPKTDYKSLMVFSKKFPHMGAGTEPHYEDVQLESQSFNKKFLVRAANPHDAFYVLTPQVMECLEKILDKFDNVAVHYIEGKLYVAINMGIQSFDADMSRKVIYEKEIEKIRCDIEVICDIINALKLSE